MADRGPLNPDDRITRLNILDLGLFHVHADGRQVGIPGYLLTTAAGHRILIDTGFAEAYATDPAAAAARDDLGSFGTLVAHGPGHLATARLAELGLGPRDIDLVILSHGHIDHVGQIDRFAHAPIIVGRAERAEPRPIYFGTARPLDWPAADWRPVDADRQLCRGLTVLSTPGHSAGHLSALIDLPETGPVLLTGDAISRPAEPAEGMAGSWDVGQAQASAARLLALARDRRAWIIWGHCPAQWPALRKGAEGYG
jgi:N-acyl homoserine lactone hydrolase